MLTTFLLVECHWGKTPWYLCPGNSAQERHYLLCPLWELDAYIHRAAQWCKNEQLFVWFGPPDKGSPASKQKMSKWVVEAISLAYESAGQHYAMAVRSHSTRSMAASKALISGVALQEVCDAAGWSSPHKFIRFFGPGLYPRFPGALVLVLLAWFHTGQALVAMVMLYWRSQSVSYTTEFPWKGMFDYDCNLGFLKREQTLRSRPYLLRACKRIAQTF